MKPVQQLADAGVGQVIEGEEGVGDVCLVHGGLLLVRDVGIGIEAEEKGEEGVEKALDRFLRYMGKEFFHALGHGLHRGAVGALEGDEILHAAVGLHVVVVHGEKLEHPRPPGQGVGQGGGEGVRRHGLVGVQQDQEVLAPEVIFSLEQGQKNFFFGLKIVVDGRAGEGRGLADVFQGDVLEAHGLIEGSAGGDDLLFAGVGPGLGGFGHGAYRLSRKIARISSRFRAL